MDVFFYGLFMDEAILLKNGIKPVNPRRGYLDNYALKIGNRASLVPCKNGRAYGIVMTIADDAIHTLYAEATVSDYVPEEVSIITTTDGPVKATCYNLPSGLLTGTNELYATSLYKLAKQLGFPDDYLAQIAMMANASPGKR